jgi:hypothetical protein
MKISQVYETTVTDVDTGLSASFVVLPKRCASFEPTDDSARELSELLGLEYLAPLRTGGLNTIASMLLTYDPAADSGRDARELIAAIQERYKNTSAEHQDFADYVYMSRIVPFESSPLSAESLGSLVTSASGVGMGAYAGFIIASSTPMMFVLVPAGMILFGAAAGVATALEQGLRQRLLNLIVRNKKAQLAAEADLNEFRKNASQSKKRQEPPKYRTHEEED